MVIYMRLYFINSQQGIINDFIRQSNRIGVPSTNHPHCSSAVESSVSTLGDAPPTEEIIFEGRTTTTPDGEEYTASLAGLPPEEQMTHWLTVDATHVVSLEDSR